MDLFDVWFWGIAPAFVAAATWAGARFSKDRGAADDIAGRLGISALIATLWPVCIALYVLYLPYLAGEKIQLAMDEAEQRKLERESIKQLQEKWKKVDENMREVDAHLARQRGDAEPESK